MHSLHTLSYEHRRENGSGDLEIHKVIITKGVSLSIGTFMFDSRITPFLPALGYLQ
jgi:hypothetical protein